MSRPSTKERSPREPSQGWSARRPTLDNPLTWALPAARFGGLTVRIHVIFLLFALVMLLQAIIGAPVGTAVTSAHLGLVALLVGSLLVIVMAHEFGHALACRWAGGTAEEILLWPLGGLAPCRPPRTWKAHLLTALGGPAVNVLICLVAGTMLGVTTGRWLGVALPNPLSPDAVLRSYGFGSTGWSWPLVALLVVNWTSLVVLLFNLLPVFPLDGGRIVQAALWPRLGYAGAMRITIAIGYLGATALGVAGALLGSWQMLGVAVVGGIVCQRAHAQLEFTESELVPSAAPAPLAPVPARVGARDEEPREVVEPRPVEPNEDAQVDEILGIIADRGLESLTPQQRAVLERATARRKAAAEGGSDGAGGTSGLDTW